MSDAKTAAWHEFVIANGWQALAHDLAAVIGQPVDAIHRLRAARVCTRLGQAKGFAELFSLWHGREPREQDWPVPRKMGARGTYEWQAPEVALLAALVGQISQREIAEVLTARLREKSGDPEAERTATSVQVRTNLIGLQTTDVVGGLTTAAAARDIGSLAIVNQMIAKGEIPTRRVGRLHVIPRDAWEAWKSKRVFPPAGDVRLSSIREPLGIKSDKLSEFARMGLIPTANRCNPYGTKGPSTQFGTWWISAETAEKLLADRRAGLPMPWHGRYTDNLRTTYKLYAKRQHPGACHTCAEIWGEKGAPKTFDDFSARYPGLAHGAKRHLTREWSPGLSLNEVATLLGCSEHRVRHAIQRGALAATRHARKLYVSRTDATRWKARKCPTGDSERSWISLATAQKQYLFTARELRCFMEQGALKSKIGTNGPMKGIVYVMRHQCGQLRERIGFTEEQAARRLGITVKRFRRLVEGVDWRQAEKVPLVTVHAVRKRLESCHGYTIEEAAEVLGQTTGWVREQITKGTTRVSRAKWDRRRVYLTEPMLKRLRKALQRPVDSEKLGAQWLRLSEAATEAAVSLATINAWGVRGELAYKEQKGVRRYHREAVRARARRYWENPRRHRQPPPDWLKEEDRCLRQPAQIHSLSSAKSLW